MKKAGSLQYKLISSILLTSLLTIGLFAVISQVRLRNNIKENLNQQILGSLEKSNQCLDMVLDKYNTILYDLCTDDDMINLVETINRGEDDLEINSSLLRRELRHICNRNTGVKGILIETSKGKKIFYDSLTHSFIKSRWLDQAYVPSVEKRQVYGWLKRPVKLGDEEIFLFQIARRLVNYEDIHKEIGTAVILIDVRQLRRAIETGSSQVYLCDNDTIVSSPAVKDIGRPVRTLYAQDRLVSSSYNQLSGLTIVNSLSLRRYHYTVFEQAMFQVLIAIGILAFMAIVVHHTYKPIIRSVDTVVKAMNAAEKGDFSIQVPIRPQMPDEIRRIAAGFNQMIDQIDLLLNQVRQAMLDQKNAELSALEAQIDPHFLYNTLDTINWKALENNQYEISEMLGALADILRYAVKNAGALTTVNQELSWLNQYMLLQSARLGKKLKQEIRAAGETRNCRIHKLLLQPFVENAIKHGLAKKQGNCLIRIRMELAQEQLHITIEDNGKGIDKETLRRLNSNEKLPGSHLGIANVRKRLELYYGHEADIYFESMQGHFTRVHLFIPSGKEESHEDTNC